MTDTHAEVDREQMASDFAETFKDKLPQETIESATAHLRSAPQAAAANTAYSATGSVASLVIWTKCQCSIKGGKTFDGSVWGVTFPGGGALFGDVYTDDVNALYAKTTNFVLIAAYAYTTFIFLDEHGNALGSFQAGSVSTVGGQGGGSGHWK
ncbi:MAG TPA: VapA/VapB family virulence-associated protein [Allosphingosinicella sp.]|jgi:hypothetical protein